MNKNIWCAILFTVFFMVVGENSKATLIETRWQIEVIEAVGVSAGTWGKGETIFWNIKYDDSSDIVWHFFNDPIFNPGVIDYSPLSRFGKITNGAFDIFNFITDVEIIFDAKTLDYMSSIPYIKPPNYNDFARSTSVISKRKDSSELLISLEDDGVHLNVSSDPNGYSNLWFRDNEMIFKVVTDNYTEPVPQPVPEPSTVILLGIGIAGVIGSRIRKN